MFPHPEHAPASCCQSAVGIGVPAAVSLDLLPPELRVLLGPSTVSGTTMPEAPVHEHGHAFDRKDNICAPSEARQQGFVDDVDNPEPVQRGPHGKLSSGVAG